jgi:hypothetical protein
MSSQGHLMRIDGAKAWDNLLANGHGRWSNVVERFHSDLMSVVPTPKLKLSATDRFFCIGSCFVRNIELELIYRDISVLSKRNVCPKEEFGHRPDRDGDQMYDGLDVERVEVGRHPAASARRVDRDQRRMD